MDYLKKVLHNLKEIGNIFTIIGVLLGLLLAFKSFPQEELIQILNAKWILGYLYLLFGASMAIIGTCFLQPLFSPRRLSTLWEWVIQSSRPLRRYPIDILVAPLFLMGLGIIIIYSLTSDYALLTSNDASFFATRQVWWIVIGSVLMVLFATTKYALFSRIAFPMMLFLIILLFTQAVGLLTAHKEMTEIGVYLRFNYWEVTKVVFIVYVAERLSTKTSKILWLIPIFVVFALIGFIEKKIGLGMVLILGLNTVSMISSKYSPIKIGKRLASLVLIILFVLSVFVYQKSQLLGGLYGVGLGNGTSDATSFQLIGFAIIEELGFIGVLIVILCFAVYFLIGLKISIRTEDDFGRLLVIGIVGVITLEAFQYILMTIFMIPITTLPLPFISYGWSDIVTNLGITGIIMNISYWNMTTRKNTINA